MNVRVTPQRLLEGVLLFGLYAIPWTVGWTVAGAHIAVGIAAAATLALGFWRRHWFLHHTPADLAMVAFTAVCVAATIGSSGRTESLVGLKKLLLLPVVHMTAAALATPRRARIGLRCVVAGLAAIAVIAMLHFVLVPHAADARLRSTSHYITFAGLLLLSFGPCAAAAATTRGRTRLLYGIALAVLGMAILLTFTRGAWIGCVVAVVVMLLRARPRLAWLVVPGVVLAFVAMPSAYRARAISSFEPNHPNNVDRLRLWRAGVAIWHDHPWIGVGLVDLKPFYLQYRATTEGQVHGHLHDNFIQILATTGGLGLLAFVWLMFGFGRAAWAAAAAVHEPELRGLTRGIWGAFWGFQCMGLFEWNFGDVEVTIALYFLLGVGLAAAAAARLPEAATVGVPGADSHPTRATRKLEMPRVSS